MESPCRQQEGKLWGERRGLTYRLCVGLVGTWWLVPAASAASCGRSICAELGELVCGLVRKVATRGAPRWQVKVKGQTPVARCPPTTPLTLDFA